MQLEISCLLILSSTIDKKTRDQIEDEIHNERNMPSLNSVYLSSDTILPLITLLYLIMIQLLLQIKIRHRNIC